MKYLAGNSFMDRDQIILCIEKFQSALRRWGFIDKNTIGKDLDLTSSILFNITLNPIECLQNLSQYLGNRDNIMISEYKRKDAGSQESLIKNEIPHIDPYSNLINILYNIFGNERFAAINSMKELIQEDVQLNYSIELNQTTQPLVFSTTPQSLTQPILHSSTKRKREVIVKSHIAQEKMERMLWIIKELNTLSPPNISVISESTTSSESTLPSKGPKPTEQKGIIGQLSDQEIPLKKRRVVVTQSSTHP